MNITNFQKDMEKKSTEAAGKGGGKMWRENMGKNVAGKGG